MGDLVGGHCDICHAMLTIGGLCWTYLTPCTGTLEEAQAGTAYWAEDPEWAACLDCHERIKAYDAGDLSEHDFLMATLIAWRENNQMVIVGMPAQEEVRFRKAAIEQAVGTMKAFLHNKAPGFVEEVNQGVPSGGGPREWGHSSD